MQEVADTSLAAYKDIVADGTIKYHEDKVMDALSKLKDGGTFLEISGMCELDYYKVEKRCAKLVNDFRIRNSGRKSNATPSRRKGIVWEIIPEDKPQVKTQIIELKPGQLKLALTK